MALDITKRIGLQRNLTAAEVDANFQVLVDALLQLIAQLLVKQDTLIAGTNITIGLDGKTISASGSGGATPIINDLTTGGISSALSAQQGLVLKGLVDGLNAALAGKQPTLTALGDVPGLVTALAAKQAALTGTGDVPGLTAALNTKAPNVLTGLPLGDASDVVATDIVLSAMGKFQAKFAQLAATIRATVLAGLSTATSTDVVAGDSVLSGIGKLQGKFTAGVGTLFALLSDRVTFDIANVNDSVRTGLSGKAALGALIDTVTGTTYAFVIGDKGRHKLFTNAAGCTATVPAGLGADFACSFSKASGAGNLTLATSGGATLFNEPNSFVMSAPTGVGGLLALPNVTDAFTAWGQFGTAASGDFTGAAASVDGELVAFNGTTGKSAKRINALSGLLKVSAGVAAAATPGTDYYSPGSPPPSNYAIDADISASTYTFVAGDSGKVKRFTAAGGCTATIPASLGVGFNCLWERSSAAGALTFAVTGGAAARAANGSASLVASVGLAGAIAPEGTDLYVIGGWLGGVLFSDRQAALTKNWRGTPVPLTDGATINTDAATGNTFSVTIAGNRTIANPTNLADGMPLRWRIQQDGTGSRTITWGSKFNFGTPGAPTLTTAAGKADWVGGMYNLATDKIECAAMFGF